MTASIVPYLILRDGPAALEFYEQAFGARVNLRIDQPDGRVGHAELDIDGASFSLADEFPEIDIIGPATLGGTSVLVELTVPDVDAVAARAVAAGATVVREVADQFHGARAGQVLDPFGHRWTITTPGEQLSAEEIQRLVDQRAADQSEAGEG